MAKDRLSLQNKLVELLGSPNVWFQPPSSLILKYPCIIYKLDDVDETYADDKTYVRSKQYLITIIDKSPDSLIYEKILDLPYSSFNTSYVVDNLNHYICSLFW